MIEQRKRFPTATNRLKQICAFAVLLSVTALPCAYSQTGAEVMNKMMSAYKGLNSYQGNANGDQIYTLTTSEKPIAQASTTVAMSYKKPNLLKLDFFTSKGSRNIFCDGTTITTYDPSGLQYVKFPSGPTMKEVAVNLQKVGVKALFDPLFFNKFLRQKRLKKMVRAGKMSNRCRFVRPKIIICTPQYRPMENVFF